MSLVSGSSRVQFPGGGTLFCKKKLACAACPRFGGGRQSWLLLPAKLRTWRQSWLMLPARWGKDNALGSGFSHRPQYKGRHHFGFISSHGITEGITTTWSWFCSCHGKCLCDPEGGTCKNTALRFETNSEGGGKLTSSWDFYAFCKANLETTSKDLFTKKRRGHFIMCQLQVRVFVQIIFIQSS